MNTERIADHDAFAEAFRSAFYERTEFNAHVSDVRAALEAALTATEGGDSGND